MVRKAYTTAELREIADEPLDAMHPHLLDAMRSALRYCADVIDAANVALAPTAHPTLAAASSKGNGEGVR